MPRLFIAIDLPSKLRERLRSLCVGVDQARWVNPQQLHVTLRFVGDTADEAMREVRRRLARVRAPGFDLSLHGVGVFPEPRGRKRPRVLWLGIEPIDELFYLKQEIDRTIGIHDKATKQTFSPHLTLARLSEKSDKPDRSLADFLANHRDFRSATWHVACFHLYQSTLHPSGAIHEPIERYGLAQPDVNG